MVVLGIPSHMENYIKIHKDVADFLQREGFIPSYMYEDFLYFKKCEELISYAEGGENE